MYTAFQVDEHTFKVCSIMGMSDSEPEDPDKGRNYFVKASSNERERGVHLHTLVDRERKCSRERG